MNVLLEWVNFGLNIAVLCMVVYVAHMQRAVPGSTPVILTAIDQLSMKTDNQMAGWRQQQSAEHDAMHGTLKHVKDSMTRMLERFRFLRPKE